MNVFEGFWQADPTYGKGVADVLGALSEVGQ